MRGIVAVRAAVVAIAVTSVACSRGTAPAAPASHSSPFEADLTFLRQHTGIVVLAPPSRTDPPSRAGRATRFGEAGGVAPSGEMPRLAQVVVAPAYQGRVMTSTTGGADAPSFGWIGRDAVAAAQRRPHINVFGGEDRFWLGPEGGQ